MRDRTSVRDNVCERIGEVMVDVVMDFAWGCHSHKTGQVSSHKCTRENGDCNKSARAVDGGAKPAQRLQGGWREGRKTCGFCCDDARRGEEVH